MRSATSNNVSLRLLRLDAPVVPIIYVSKLTNLLDREGISVESILQSCDLKRSSFFDPQATISTLQLKSLVKAYIDVSTNTNLAFELGKALDFDAHGLSYHNAFYGLKIGFILSTSIEYLKVRVPLVELDIEYSDTEAVMTIEVAPELQEIEQFTVETIVGSYCTMFGNQMPVKRLLLSYGASENKQSYTNLLNTNVIFNSQKHQMVFDKLSLDALFKPSLEVKGNSTLKSQNKNEEEFIVDKVRAIISSEYDAFVSLEKVASLLELSPRTCRRQLKTQGYSYKKIREEILYTKALSYLTESNLPVEDIALKLGYSDNANFRRAFKRWAGKPPSAFRNELTNSN